MSLFDVFNDTVGSFARTVAAPFRKSPDASLDETIGAITARPQKDRQPPEDLEQRGLLSLETFQVAEVAEVVEACQAAGKPELAAGFLKAGLSLEAAKQRLADAAPPADVAAMRSNAAAIVTACEAAGVDYLAPVLINKNISLDEARTHIAEAAEIREAFELAARIAPAAINAEMARGYIVAGAGIAHVRSEIFSAMVAEQEKQPTSPHFAIGAAAAGNGWDAAISRINAGK